MAPWVQQNAVDRPLGIDRVGTIAVISSNAASVTMPEGLLAETGNQTSRTCRRLRRSRQG
jgi:hypothetical protein